MKKCLVLALLLLAAAGEAAAAAARVDFTYGHVTVSGPDGTERPLVRGAALDNGDTVRTAEGRAQLRFNDGAYVSLQPNSEFAIRDYRFDGKTDGAERGFFGLARGAMRTVTGLIGRVNRDRYQVTTPTATIGIRGTGGVIQVLDDGSTLIVGTSGIWSLTNPAGSVDVPAGMSAVSPGSGEQPPQRSSRAPQAGPAPLAPETALPPLAAEFRQGDQTDPDGRPAGFPRTLSTPPAPTPDPAPVTPPPDPPPPPPPPPPPTVLSSGGGFTAAFAFARVDDAAPRLVLGTGATAQFNASGELLQAELAPELYRLDGTHADFATDGILAWGRWTGQTMPGAGTTTYSENQGLHYVIGTPTPVLPTAGTATYTLAGATRPTYMNDTGIGPGTFSGSLSVNFGTTAVSTVDWRVTMPDRTYSIDNTALSLQSGSAFAATGAVTQGCLNPASCSTDISGFFAGANAERFGAGYRINDGAGQVANGTAVVGAAAFSKQ